MHDSSFTSIFDLGTIIIGTSSAFVKKKTFMGCVSHILFIIIWPSKISNGPQKVLKGAKNGPKSYDQEKTLHICDQRNHLYK